MTLFKEHLSMQIYLADPRNFNIPPEKTKVKSVLESDDYKLLLRNQVDLIKLIISNLEISLDCTAQIEHYRTEYTSQRKLLNTMKNEGVVVSIYEQVPPLLPEDLSIQFDLDLLHFEAHEQIALSTEGNATEASLTSEDTHKTQSATRKRKAKGFYSDLSEDGINQKKSTEANAAAKYRAKKAHELETLQNQYSKLNVDKSSLQATLTTLISEYKQLGLSETPASLSFLLTDVKDTMYPKHQGPAFFAQPLLAKVPTPDTTGMTPEQIKVVRRDLHAERNRVSARNSHTKNKNKEIELRYNLQNITNEIGDLTSCIQKLTVALELVKTQALSSSVLKGP